MRNRIAVPIQKTIRIKGGGKPADFINPHPIVQGRLVRNIAHTPPDFERFTLRIQATHFGSTGCRLLKSRQDSNQSCFARTILTQQGKDRPLRYRQIDTLQSIAARKLHL